MKYTGGSDKLTKLLSIVHFLLIFGCAAYSILSHYRKNKNYTLLQMIIVGGFLFHMMWEAKTLYVIPYFVILAPISIKGYSHIVEEMDKLKEYRGKKKYINPFTLFSFTFIGLAFFIGVNNSDIIHYTIKLDKDTQAYSKYIEFNTTDKIKEGDYNIYLFANQNKKIQISNITSEQSADIGLVELNDENTFSKDIKINFVDDRIHFRFNDTNLYLDLNENKEIDNGYVQAWSGSNSDAQKWVIKHDDADTYYILIGSRSALTYNETDNRICIKELTYADNQKWVIR